MAKHKVEDIRNIALVGHAYAGKTSLADALLFAGKAVSRRGCVDDGTSVSDYDEEEHKQKFSIDTSVLHFEHKGKQVHLLDAPGKPEFTGAALTALNAVETAVIVISAPNGIEVNTRRMFKEAGKRGLARVLVINKMDADNIDFPGLLTAIRESFGKAVVLLDAPVGVGAQFTGDISVLHPPEQAPATCPIDLSASRSRLVDAIVESDEALMEKYLTEGDVSDAELEHALPHALATGAVIPILCTSTKKGLDIGITELLEALVDDGESPIDAHKHTAVRSNGQKSEEVTLPPSEAGEFVGQVFKTLNDKFVGNLSFIRVYSGRITPENQLFNARTGKGSRFGGLLQMQGKEQKTVPEAIAGDIVAVAKVEDLHIGDTVGINANVPKLPAPEFPLPMFGLAVEPKARGDEQKISTSLTKIANEDPTFQVTRDAQTHEMVITGMSQLHLDIIQHRLKRRYELEIVTKEPKIPYRETIMGNADAEYQHKKQSGGRGQYAKVHLRVYPLSREITTKEEFFENFAVKSRFEKIRLDTCHYDPEHNFGFIDHIVGGSIPNQFIPAVEKGCKELLDRGALAGYRIQDVAVEVHFGKYHDVDSSEAAFKTAGRMAFKKAFLAARPELLEPIVDLEVTAPSRYTGAILSDLNTKRARVENQDSLPGDLAVIQAKAPLAEVMRYAAVLGSITQGQGAYTMHFSHYDQVPANVKQQIVSKAKVAHDEDEE